MPHRPVQRVLLVVPPTGAYIREDRCQTPIAHMATIALRPPIDLLYAGAAFQAAGAVCRLVDYPAEGLDGEEGVQRLLSDLGDFRPEFVLASITTPGLDADMACLARIKERFPSVITAAKGAHFNVLDREALLQYPGLDLAFRGEFEPACRELAEGRPPEEVAGLTFRDAAGQVQRTPDRGFIEDLDTLPFPARHLARNELYTRPDTGEPQTTIVTNRGCPFECCFCLANQVAGRRNRMRSVDNILDEIEECVGELGIRNFLFRSDLFTAKRDWVLALCRGIHDRGLKIAWSCNSRVDTVDLDLLREMRRAGCWIMAFGVESGSAEMLERMNKRVDLEAARRALAMTREAGILSSVYFLMGLPWEREETLEENDVFARELEPDILEVFYVYPFPGTRLYEDAVSLGLLRPGEIPTRAYDGPAMPTLYLSRRELASARRRSLRRYYLRPRVVFRTLRRASSWREFINYVRYGWRQLVDFLGIGGTF